jgi:hypothetical protein
MKSLSPLLATFSSAQSKVFMPCLKSLGTTTQTLSSLGGGHADWSDFIATWFFD